MRVSLLILAVAIMADRALAQSAYYPLDVGTTWSWQQYWSTSSVIQQVLQDTLMPNGKHYSQIAPRIMALDVRSERQEGNKVYRYGSGSQQEWLLFDFSASAGDTINHSPVITVADVRYDTLFGRQAKTWVFLVDYIPGAIDDEEVYTVTDSIAVTDYTAANSAMRVIGAKVGSRTFGKLAGVQVSRILILQGFELFPNYPNPFNGQTNIRFSLRKVAAVTVSIRDLMGREIQRSSNNSLAPGMHQFVWDASNVPTGTYFCDLAVDKEHRVIRMVLIK